MCAPVFSSLIYRKSHRRPRSRRARKPHLYSVGVIGRIRGALSRSRQMRCFKKEKRSKRETRPRARGRGRSREMNKMEKKSAVAGYARSCAYISYAGGGCFAWSGQYYYHIFRIMRSRVCLLFHATPLSLLSLPRQEGRRRV